MKSIAIVALVAMSWAWPACAAVDPDELADIRQQLQGLMQRVERLEQENAELKAHNETLQVQGEYLRAETRGLRKESAQHAAEVDKVKGADWAGRVAVKGDLRYRHEQIEDDLTNDASSGDARYRDRIRARIGVEGRATEDLLLGFQLATGGDDPRSANQTLGGVSSRKPVGVDLAYFDWKYSDWGNVVGGKMKLPFARPGQSLFYDGDINPEGIAFGFKRGIWFASAYNFWIEERSTSADSLLWGMQLGARLPIRDSSLMLALQYSDLVKGQGFRPFHNCTSLAVSAATIGCANGNTVVLAGPGNPVLAHDFNIVELAAEWTTNIGLWPLQVWANLAENQDPDDLNLAWGAGVVLGKAANFRTWEAGVGYQSIEKDALFGQMIDSDFADGRTDTAGWFFRGGYAPVRNWTLNASYFLNERNVDVGARSDYHRLQLDFNVKF